MSARVLAVLTLAASVGLATPWVGREPAAVAAPTGAAVATDVATPYAHEKDSVAELYFAVEAAVRTHVPGVAGTDWTLHRLYHSDPDADGLRHVVANGVVADPGAPGTGVKLAGHYDPATGTLTRVSYRLQPSAGRVAVARNEVPAVPGATWSVQSAVQQALADALPGQEVRFALDSAQATRLDDGGRRFEGFGIGTWGDGGARFVAFTLVLSKGGERTAFDYGTQTADDGAMVASQ